MSALPATTIPELFLSRVHASFDSTALLVPTGDHFQPVTWRAIADDVGRLSAAIAKAGVRTGDRVVLLSENRYEWIVTDLAIQFAGGIHVPLNCLSTSQQVNQLITDCAPSLVIASTEEQQNKVDECTANAPVWVLDEIAELGGTGDVGSLDKDSVSPDSLISILYTSGTTGDSKGVMLTQANVVSNVYGKLARLPLGPDDVRWCMLPMSHIFARTCDWYTWIAAGCVNAISRGRDHWLEELALIRPTYINSVPYFYEKLYRIVRDRNQLENPAALRDLLGGRINIANCGGAAIRDTIFDYYRDKDIGLVTGYGLTETSPVVTSSTPNQVRRGAVGIALPDVELSIAADGEILVRGPNVMQGYFRNPSATAESFSDGWFRTGDLGYLDGDAFLFITGRKKELIVTSGGRNISTLSIEAEINAHEYFDQSAVFGDGRDYLVAVVVLNRHAGDQIEASEIQEALQVQLDHRPPYERIDKFIIAAEAFTIENGLLTAKGTLRRHAVWDRYRDSLESLYAAPAAAGLRPGDRATKTASATDAASD